jgi:acetyltransferase-like isoleucine patch superfamily enzyme
MNFYELLKQWRLYEQKQTHQKNLYSKAVIGNNFCSEKVFGANSILNINIVNRSNDPSKIKIGNYCNIFGSLFCNEYGEINIGDYVFMNNGCSIRSDHKVVIGSHCLFGPRVEIIDTDSHPLSRSKRHQQARLIPEQLINTYEADGKPIIIGDDVWVCLGSLILGGVAIGDGSIIAAHSVVTKSIPPMSIAAGIPAQVIGRVPS